MGIGGVGKDMLYVVCCMMYAVCYICSVIVVCTTNTVYFILLRLIFWPPVKQFALFQNAR